MVTQDRINVFFVVSIADGVTEKDQLIADSQEHFNLCKQGAEEFFNAYVKSLHKRPQPPATP